MLVRGRDVVILCCFVVWLRCRVVVLFCCCDVVMFRDGVVLVCGVVALL